MSDGLSRLPNGPAPKRRRKPVDYRIFRADLVDNKSSGKRAHTNYDDIFSSADSVGSSSDIDATTMSAPKRQREPSLDLDAPTLSSPTKRQRTGGLVLPPFDIDSMVKNASHAAEIEVKKFEAEIKACYELEAEKHKAKLREEIKRELKAELQFELLQAASTKTKTTELVACDGLMQQVENDTDGLVTRFKALLEQGIESALKGKKPVETIVSESADALQAAMAERANAGSVSGLPDGVKIEIKERLKNEVKERVEADLKAGLEEKFKKEIMQELEEELKEMRDIYQGGITM